MKRLLVVLVALVMAATSHGIAAATTNPPPPRDANAAKWLKYYMATPPDWVPQGTVVADSGFRPYPNGFGFWNPGRVDKRNHDVFGAPLDPIKADARSMRSMMGPVVCRGGNRRGDCDLTLAAEQWLSTMNARASGGFCFGMAAVAAIFAEGLLHPQSFQHDVTEPYNLNLTPRLSRTISANLNKQYTSQLHLTSARNVVQRLLRRLTPGRTPFLLGMTGQAGGHAVTPYAVLDRGEGKYDIAVYDNNYPGAPRAIKVDTKSNTWSYLVVEVPGAPPVIMDGQMGLLRVSRLTRQQRCPFCPGAARMTVLPAPVVSDIPLRVRVRRPNGGKLQGVRVSPATEPWQPGQPWTFPSFSIPKGKPFILEFPNRRNPDGYDVDVAATSEVYTLGVTRAHIPAGSVTRIGLRPRRGIVVYGSADPGLGAISFTDADWERSSEVEVTGSARSGNDPVVAGQIRQQAREVSFGTILGRPGRVRARVVFEGSEGQEYVARIRRRLPKRTDLVISYARWRSGQPHSLVVMLRRGERQRVIPVKVRVRSEGDPGSATSSHNPSGRS